MGSAVAPRAPLLYHDALVNRTATGTMMSIALGLPSALLAHGLVFGHEHAVAGAFQSFAWAGAFFAFAAIALLHARDATQGSIIAARLRRLTPSIPALTASAALWFALFESVESAHEPLVLLSALALVVASIVIQFAASLFGDVIGGAVLAIVRACVARDVRPVIIFHASPVLAFTEPVARGRRYCRPPPALS